MKLNVAQLVVVNYLNPLPIAFTRFEISGSVAHILDPDVAADDDDNNDDDGLSDVVVVVDAPPICCGDVTITGLSLIIALLPIRSRSAC